MECLICNVKPFGTFFSFSWILYANNTFLHLLEVPILLIPTVQDRERHAGFENTKK